MRDHLAGLDATHVSYSELNTLATCEQKWYENYVLRNEGPPSLAMRFGTVIHKAVEGWWGCDNGTLAPDWATEWVYTAAGDEQVELPDEGPRSYDDAAWLFHRYTDVYQAWKHEGWHRWEGCDGELSLHGTVRGISVRVTPDDFLVDPAGKLVLVERKTMASWQRLDLVDVTPQESIQVWAALGEGIEVDRVLFDAIKSYRWALVVPTQKELIEGRVEGDDLHLPWNPPFNGDHEWAGIPQESKRRTAWAKWAQSLHPGVEKHAPEDSFQAVEVWRDEEQIDGAVDWMHSILRRRHTLLENADPIRSIGNGCRSCAYQDKCWTEMAFPDRSGFVIDDEVDE